MLPSGYGTVSLFPLEGCQLARDSTERSKGTDGLQDIASLTIPI